MNKQRSSNNKATARSSRVQATLVVKCKEEVQSDFKRVNPLLISVDAHRDVPGIDTTRVNSSPNSGISN